jgi:hypothetical protein
LRGRWSIAEMAGIAEKQFARPSQINRPPDQRLC